MSSPADRANRDDLAALLCAALEQAMTTLGPGWRLHYKTPRHGSDAASSSAGISAVLINAQLGVALLDVAPRITTAEQPGKPAEQLRRELKAGGIPDPLLRKMPIVHLVVTPGRMTRLSAALRYAFTWEPPLSIPPDKKWADRVAQIVSAAPSENPHSPGSTGPASPTLAARARPRPGRTRALRGAGWFPLPERH
jgi:hypothetical protein